MTSEQTQQTVEIITLADIINILFRHKKLFIAIFTLGVLASLLFALIVPKKYQYTQFIQPAYYINQQGKKITVEPVQDVLIQVQSIYLPNFLDQHLDNRKVKKILSMIKASNLDNSNLIKLKVVTPKQSLSTLQAILSDFVNYIVQQQNEKLLLLKKAWQAQIDRLYVQAKILTNDLSEAQSGIKQLRLAANTISSKPSSVQRDFEENYVLSQYSQFLNMKASFTEQFFNVNQQITVVERNINSLQPTIANGNLIRSAEPVGLSKRLILVLGVVLSFLLALMVVLLRGALTNINFKS